ASPGLSSKSQSLDLLLDGGGLVEFRCLDVRGFNAKGLLQPFAGLEAIAARKAFGLNSRLTLGRDRHFDDAHYASPIQWFLEIDDGLVKCPSCNFRLTAARAWSHASACQPPMRASQTSRRLRT